MLTTDRIDDDNLPQLIIVSRKSVEIIGDTYHFSCPHCNGRIIVEKNEVNCQIFRHGIMKDSTGVSPHLPQKECEELLSSGRVLGCMKPFRFVFAEPENYVEICDYI